MAIAVDYATKSTADKPEAPPPPPAGSSSNPQVDPSANRPTVTSKDLASKVQGQVASTTGPKMPPHGPGGPGMMGMKVRSGIMNPGGNGPAKPVPNDSQIAGQWYDKESSKNGG